MEGPALLNEYARTAKSLDKTGEFVGWLASKRDVYTQPVQTTDGIWFDIGTLDQLDEARTTISKLHMGDHPSPSGVESAIRKAAADTSTKLPNADDLSRRLQASRTFLDVIRILARPDAIDRAVAATILGQVQIGAAIPWLLDCTDDSRAAAGFETVAGCALSALVSLGYASNKESARAKARKQGFARA
jgi:hypothetical protein